MSKTTNRIKAVGSAARLSVGRDAGIKGVYPIRDDVVEDSEAAESLLRHLYHQAHGRRFWVGPRVLFSVPGYSTYVEERALVEAAVRAGASRVFLVSSALAAALGADVPITQSKGTMIVYIGRSDTEIAIFSNGKIVAAKSLKTGTGEMDRGIVHSLSRRYDFQVSSTTAERIRSEIGTAYPSDENLEIEVVGRPIHEGIPRSRKVSSKDIHDALEGPLSTIIENLRSVVARAPVEFVGDIFDTGIHLSGEGALLRDIARRLQAEVNLSVSVAADPPAALVLGIMRYLGSWNLDTAQPLSWTREDHVHEGGEQNLPASHVPANVPNHSRFHSCFLSYSHADGNFAEQLYADLQEAGVTCFFAPKNLPIGALTWPALNENVRRHDKLLLILSANSVRSQWVGQEVESALAKESTQDQTVLFPVRIDDAILKHQGGWPEQIRNTRHIGDFTAWREPRLYRLSLERLLKDLHPAGL